MKSRITQIRDMSVIEKALEAEKTGVLSFISQDEDLLQATVPYLYLDKNVHFFFEETDETFLNINFESSVSFAVSKAGGGEENEAGQKGFRYLQVLFRGIIRRVEETRDAEELYSRFIEKYHAGSQGEEAFVGIRAAFIDTEEIQASSFLV
ncbi:MAG TPA: hypothetical protein VHO03_17830 [Ignavibacteriales bacterium]|nr:hypothetical protein [Ignavibacteriales bacterium]